VASQTRQAAGILEHLVETGPLVRPLCAADARGPSGWQCVAVGWLSASRPFQMADAPRKRGTAIPRKNPFQL